MFPLTRALQLDHPVPSFVRYVACIFVWLGLWLMSLLKRQVGFVEGRGTFGVPALWARLLLCEQALLPLPPVEGACKPISLQLLVHSRSRKPFPITTSFCLCLAFCRGLEKCFIKWNRNLITN